jgi:hypothetical protein
MAKKRATSVASTRQHWLRWPTQRSDAGSGALRGKATCILGRQHEATLAPAAYAAKQCGLRRPTRRREAGSGGLRNTQPRSLPGHNPPLHWVRRSGKRPHHFPIPISIPKTQTMDRIFSSPHVPIPPHISLVNKRHLSL